MSWALPSCNTKQGGTERQSGAREEQDEGAEGRHRSGDQQAQQPELAHTFKTATEKGREGEREGVEEQEGDVKDKKRETYSIEVTELVSQFEISPLNEDAKTNMSLRVVHHD